MRRRAGWTPSSSTPRAAARRSRITATCSATRPLAEDAARVADLAMDVSEVLIEARPAEGGAAPRLRVAYHAACSLQHGQQIKTHPKDLLKSRRVRGGRAARQPSVLRLGGHLQPDAARDLGAAQGRARSRRSRRQRPEVIAAGNIGCMMQIGSGTADADRPHGRTAGLGHGRAEAARAGGSARSGLTWAPSASR